jgi:tetratricopeptide (TPR) repeat protein
MGRHGEAVALLERLVADDPQLSSLERQLADTLAAGTRYAEAEERYREILSKEPRDIDARLRLATAATLAGRYEAAVEALEEGLSVGVRRPELQHALATLLATAPDDRVRDGARAVSLAREALADRATLERAETVGLALAAAGDFEQAAQWQRKILARLGEAQSSALGLRLRSNLDRYLRGERGLAPWHSGSQPERLPRDSATSSEAAPPPKVTPGG